MVVHFTGRGRLSGQDDNSERTDLLETGNAVSLVKEVLKQDTVIQILHDEQRVAQGFHGDPA